MRSKEFIRLEGSTLHYLGLLALLLLGASLRFWQLDLKPLWLDEVITALFSLGKSYADVPLEVPFPLSALDRLFTFQPGVSCAHIAQTVSTDSVHPPLFFCLMYQWMDWFRPDQEHWVWVLRALPALIGVGAIAALYLLNRVAFSPAAGLMGAALMAVSPFAVYLSQEARHYTLPMLLIILALTGLVQIQRDLLSSRSLRPLMWLGWVGVNILGFYVHYFFVLALIAQIFSLVGWMALQRHPISTKRWGAVGLAIATIGLGYLPWTLTLLHHLSRPETNWLKHYDPDWVDRIAPLYQTLAGWVVMVMALPVEDQPWAIAIPSILIMLLFAVWVAWQTVRGLKQWRHSPAQPPLVLLISFTVCILAQFFAIVYILNKDLTVVPRYNFVYYPGICALLGAGLASPPGSHLGTSRVGRGRSHRIQAIILLGGIVSSLFVVNDFAFHKSYYPHKVAQSLHLESSQPLMVVMSHQSLQEVALGLSFALELRKLSPTAEEDFTRFVFLERPLRQRQFWSHLSRLPQLPPPFNLWVISSPGTKARDYPTELTLANPSSPKVAPAVCTSISGQYSRLGSPHQLYHCNQA